MNQCFPCQYSRWVFTLFLTILNGSVKTNRVSVGIVGRQDVKKTKKEAEPVPEITVRNEGTIFKTVQDLVEGTN